MNELLSVAAAAWDKLVDYSYYLTYGKKGKLLKLELYFSADRFMHIAGFQHLTDIQLPWAGSQKKMYERILSGQIREEHIVKSAYYPDYVEPRLRAILMLGEMLEGNFSTFLFAPKRLPFYTDISAKYLISDENAQIVFLFTDEECEKRLFPKSLFLKDKRDYTKNQTHLTLLKKERVNHLTGETVTLFCKDGYAE